MFVFGYKHRETAVATATEAAVVAAVVAAAVVLNFKIVFFRRRKSSLIQLSDHRLQLHTVL